LHKDLEKLIIEHNITIPILHIKGSVYLIGDKKHIIQQNSNSFTVRVGGGHFKFEEYVPNNHKYFEKALLMNMIKSKESLEWVCEALMNEQRIPQAAAAYDVKDAVVEINRRLPTRSNDENRSPNKAGEQSPLRRGSTAGGPTQERRASVTGLSSPRRSTAGMSALSPQRPLQRRSSQLGAASPGRASTATSPGGKRRHSIV